MNKKIFICFIALVLLAATAHAACDYSAKEKITAECYKDANSYSNPDFYKNSNPAQWDIKQVKWDNPAVWTNPNIQTTLNTNENARNEYFKKAGCTGCTFVKAAGFTDSVTFSSTGIKHQNGDFVTPKNYPEGTTISAGKNGITILLTSKAKVITVPATDTLTINTAFSNNPTLDIAGIPPGVILKGSLSFKNGQAYVKAGDSATINNVEIKAVETMFIEDPKGTETSENEDGKIIKGTYKKNNAGILIFFSGEPQPQAENKDYISLSPLTRKMFINSQSEFGFEKISFKENNPFFKIEKKDELSMWPIEHAEISIQNRDYKNMIPAVNIKAKNEHAFAEISSGNADVIFRRDVKGKFELNSFFSDYNDAGSSPMSITAKDEKGKSVIGTDKDPKKIVIDNFNGFVTIGENKQEGLGQDGYAVSENLKMNYDPQSAVQGGAIVLTKRPSDQTLQRTIATSNGKIVIIGVTDPAMAREIYDSLLKMPTKLGGSVSAIQIANSDEEFARLYNGNPKSDTSDITAFAGAEGIIVFKKEEFNQRNLYHESGHERVYSLGETNSAFSNAWNAAAGNVYGKGLAPPGSGNPNSVAWADGSTGAKNGCVEAYGCNKLHEDVATFTEIAYAKPDNMKTLVRGKDPRYLQKFDLCCSYGFVDDAQYKLITGNARKCGEAK